MSSIQQKGYVRRLAKVVVHRIMRIHLEQYAMFGKNPQIFTYVLQIYSTSADKKNIVYLKSVHFKKTVARISFLSKLWYFQYKSKQKVPQF